VVSIKPKQMAIDIYEVIRDDKGNASRRTNATRKVSHLLLPFCSTSSDAGILAIATP